MKYCIIIIYVISLLVLYFNNKKLIKAIKDEDSNNFLNHDIVAFIITIMPILNTITLLLSIKIKWKK